MSERSREEMSGSKVLLRKWKARISNWEQSGITQGTYCKREGLKLTRFCYWRMKINKLKGKADSSSKHSIVKAGRIGLKPNHQTDSNCNMRLWFEDYCLELKDEFSSLGLGRVIKVLRDL